jgi:tRNA 5-methylaminomethyl-2-thiouridine biosynthesis bifunctional protein
MHTMNRIDNPSLDWGAAGNPVSTAYEDVYYSKQNGLEETHLTFLEGNNLPAAWLGQDQFTIAETGFGTGLNFLATWKLFEETAAGNERLDFISFEKFPIHKDDLTKALNSWRTEIGDSRIDRFLKIYPPRFPGFHRRWVTDRVTLTVIFDDALRGLKQLDCPVDAWYLDGFAPKRNQDLWSVDVFKEMARLSHSTTTLASFSAAGDVRRGLGEVGFSIKRHKGYKYKWHRITGTFNSEVIKPALAKPDHVTIIGTGLAGSTVAHALKRKGIAVTFLEKEDAIGQGASGNKLGLINPRIEVQDNPRNDAGLSAFSLTNHVLDDIPNIEYTQNGALHLFVGEVKQEKFQKIAARHEWLSPHLQLREDGVFYADSATVNTAALVKTLLADHTVHFNHKLAFDQLPQGINVLACGWGLHEFEILQQVPLQPVRGQVTYAVTSSPVTSHPVMFGHYVAPVPSGGISMGASFEQNSDQVILKDSDDETNIAAVQNHMDLKDLTITGRWANVRTASRDRFSIVGQHTQAKNLYITGALGSHGIQFSILHAEIIACLLTGTPLPIGKDALQSLSLQRFY